jgi:hypothetical protein
MKTYGLIGLLALSLAGSQLRAEYMEIAASQIVTATVGETASPSVLVRWELPQELDKLIIDAAVIAMTVPVDGAEPLEVDAHPILKSWDAKEAESAEEWSTGEKVYDDEVASPAIITEENAGKISLDVYLQVLDQIAGKAENFGFILVPESGATSKIQPIEANAPIPLADAKLIIAYRTQR